MLKQAAPLACVIAALMTLSACAADPATATFDDRLEPLPATAIFSDPGHYTWGGSMVRTDDGVCHLLYSRWPKDKGFSAWVTHSEIAHAVADNPLGPYRFVNVALPARGAEFWDGLCTHNPTVQRFGDKYYLYYMGNTGDGKATKRLNMIHRNNQRIGVAVADDPAGPWKRFDKPVIDVGPGDAPDALMTSNPSITKRPDGGYLMVYKAVGKTKPLPFGGPVVHLVATADSPTGPFKKYPDPVFIVPGVNFPAEDPYIWSQDGIYWAIVKDMRGHFTGAGRSTALFYSRDGIHWGPTDHPLVATTTIKLADGSTRELEALERPQVWLDKSGRPAVLFFAAREKDHDKLSYNVHIPLKSPR
ncbi:sucrase [Planctomycetales bacterium ZRK34]|nr:sucrase [Planctomycetales bacterium ZRK34]